MAEIRALAGLVRGFGPLRLPFGDHCPAGREMDAQWTHFLAPPVPRALESSDGGALALQLMVFPGKRPGETETEREMGCFHEFCFLAYLFVCVSFPETGL